MFLIFFSQKVSITGFQAFFKRFKKWFAIYLAKIKYSLKAFKVLNNIL